MRVQLTGEEPANIAGSQLRNIDSAFFEFLSQQPTRNTNPVSACPGRQSIHIAQMFVVAVQFLGNVIRWLCAERGTVRSGVVHNGLLK